MNPSTPHSTRGPRLRVLVADDSPTVRTALRLLLVANGHAADLVPDGMQALDALRRGGYDAVLMDVQMPIMGGIEAVERFHREDRSPSPPRVIGISAESSTEDRDRCREAGMDDFLAKPIQIQPLLEALGRCRRGSRGTVEFGSGARGTERMYRGLGGSAWEEPGTTSARTG